MGFFSSIGSVMNDVTGATSASKLNNKYQKEFAQNAHQWEMEDLKKAGLNPIMSAGGSGATASGGGTAGSAGGGLSDIANSAVNLTQTMNDIKRVENETDLKEAETNLKKAETANATAQNPYVAPKAKAEIANLGSSTMLNSAKKSESWANADYQGRRSGGYSKHSAHSYGTQGISKSTSITY